MNSRRSEGRNVKNIFILKTLTTHRDPDFVRNQIEKLSIRILNVLLVVAPLVPPFRGC
jgi:hypothetical protein